MGKLIGIFVALPLIVLFIVALSVSRFLERVLVGHEK